jgi:hypothetical protein
MSNRINRSLLAGIVALGLGASALTANAVEDAKTAPVKPAEQSPAKPAGMAVDFARLGQILDDMGYEYKKVSDTCYEVVLKRDNWAVYLRIYFSPDRTRLWLTSTLADIADVAQAPHEILVKLLEGNMTYGPSHFFMQNDPKNPARRWLKITRPIDNRGINARTLREQIDTLFTTIRDTKALWLASEWKNLKATTTVSADKKDAKDAK